MEGIEQLGIFDWAMLVLICTFVIFLLFGAASAVMSMIYKETLLNNPCTLCAQQHPELMCIYPSKFLLNITI